MIVVGLGSPFLTDDSVGPRVIRELARAGAEPGVRYVETHAGGLLLVEELAGADRAVIVDALLDPRRRPGEVVVAGISGASHNVSGSHDCTLPEVLSLARAIGIHLPDDDAIRLVGVVASDVTTFSETLTPEVEAALPEACAVVRACLDLTPDGRRDA
jgi:hydrogenase maturation protease